MMECSIGKGVLCFTAFLGVQTGLNWMEQASDRDLPWSLLFAGLLAIILILALLRKRRMG